MYNNAKGSKCKYGKCIAGLKKGYDCTGGDTNPDSKMCPEDTYCDATKKCVDALDLAATCTKTSPCKSGLGCIGNADGSAYTWQKMGAAANGAQYKIDNLYLSTAFVSQKAFCSSYNSYDIGNGVFEWRPGDISSDKSEGDLKRTNPATMCKYVTYNDATATATTGVSKEEPPKCGFNTDNNYYCNKRYGDSYFQNTYTSIKRLDLRVYYCHVNADWSKCQSFVIPNKDLLLELVKRQY